MNTDNTDDIKFTALEASVYCPPFSDEKPIETVDLDGEFDVEKAKNAVRHSVELLSYQRSHRPMILEVLDVLDRNSAHFLLDKQNYISFYWSGILVLRINVNKTDEVGHNKQLHVSLQKYKVEKDRLEAEKNNTRLVTLGLWGTAAVAALSSVAFLLNRFGNSRN